MTCEERQDNIYLHAAGALEGGDLGELQQHLATGCPTCTGTYASAQATLAQYALALQGPAVPSRAKSVLDRRINESAEESVSPSERERLMIRPERSRLAWGQMLLAACVVGGLTLGAAFLMSQKQADQHATAIQGVTTEKQTLSEQLAKAESDRAAVATQLASAEKMLADIQAALTAAQRQNTDLLAQNKDLREDLAAAQTDLAATQQVAQMLASKQLVMLDLKGQGDAPDSQARLLVDLQHKIWRLYTADLKPVPNRVFEFWLITAEGATVPMGSFTTDAKGQGVLSGTVPDPLPPLAQAAITDEPAPGAKAPTGKMHVLGKF